MNIVSQDFIIQDVPMKTILDIGKLVQSSPESMSIQNILKGMDSIAGQSYVKRGISMAKQMNLIESTDERKFKGSAEYRTDFEKILISDYPILANKVLQNYPPFSKYLDFLIIGYEHEHASNFVSGIYDLEKKNCDNFFKKSGSYAKLTEKENDQIKIVQTVSPDLDYITNLKNFLNSEVESKKLIQQLLGPGAFTYFSKKNINFDKPAKALVEIKQDPKTSFYKIGEFLELCMYALGKDMGADVQSAHGIGQLANQMRTRNKAIAGNPTSIAVGLGSLRNMSNHGPDKDTGHTWIFTEESSFGGSLLGIRLLRNFYEYYFNQLQEI